MEIDDIPLPPNMSRKNDSKERDNGFNVPHTINGTNHSLATKRVSNHKLPLGVLKKESLTEQNESLLPKRELFLPTVNDKLQLALSNLKGQKRDSVAALLVKNYGEYDKTSLKAEVIKSNSRRRRSNEKEDTRESKRGRVDRRSCERITDRDTCRVRSQVVVRDWGERSCRGNESRYERERWRRRDHSRQRRDKSRSTYRIKRSRRSPSRHRRRDSPPRKRRSSGYNGHYRDKSVHKSSTRRRSPPRVLTAEYRHRRRSYSSKKSSFVSSTSHSRSSSSSSEQRLPAVSPKSPEESPPHIVPQPPPVTTTSANVYLKQLKDTLDKINVVYKNVVSQIPDQKTCVELDVCNIPLPSEDIVVDTQPQTKVEPVTPIVAPSPDVIITNGNKPIKQGHRTRSNSLNFDKLSFVSDCSMYSKNLRSPLCSFNVSSYSKGSETSDSIRSRPVFPKIITSHIDYSDIDQSLLAHYSSDFFVNTIKCHCTMPNPDQWNNDNIRACGHGQNCLLRQLRIECNSERCPTESLCTNCQFQQLDDSVTRNNNAELFFDVSQTLSWKLRSRREARKEKLLFEVGGKAIMTKSNENEHESFTDSESDILITKDIKLPLRYDHQTLIYYLRHGSADEANVHIEKWLVDGRLRLGVFALVDIEPKTELVMVYSNDCLLTDIERVSLDTEDHLLTAMQSLVHDNHAITHTNLVVLLDKLMSPYNPSWLLDRCVQMGGVPLLYISCLQYISQSHINEQVLTRLVDLVNLVSYGKNCDPCTLGIDLSALFSHLTNIAQSLWLLPSTLQQLDMLRRGLSNQCEKTTSSKTVPNSSDNLYTLNCRLPTYWCSRECVCDDKVRVFFYHKITKHVQWDMPVYPWESNDDDKANIYDYNNASSCQVTHNEIGRMYLNLNKMYEIKQKRILCKETNLKPTKEYTDGLKKELFRKKIMDFIVQLLKPYRDPGCLEGRITSDEDLRYLANKLSQTIMFKELKILNNITDYLAVTDIVENKTRTYVRTYLQSRGSTYKRPPHHQSDTIQKRAT